MPVELRPFYVIGHNPNSIEQVKQALAAGANAIEPDINVLRAHRDQLCVAHGPPLGVGPGANHSTPLEPFLKDLRELARDHSALSLVYFDCKTLAATPFLGHTLLQAVRTHLIGSGAARIDLNVILSVATLKETAIFDAIRTELQPGEALMVDGESDPRRVADSFAQLDARHHCYGNGTSFVNGMSSWFARHVRPSIEQACDLRAQGKTRLVVTWTVNRPASVEDYVRIGVDGIIADASPTLLNPGDGLPALVALVKERGADLGIRLATRADRPFDP
jgi:glycerophosphoryl diester phosphodiesterase